MNTNMFSNIGIISTVLVLAVSSGVMAEWHHTTGETIIESWQRYEQEIKAEEGGVFHSITFKKHDSASGHDSRKDQLLFGLYNYSMALAH